MMGDALSSYMVPNKSIYIKEVGDNVTVPGASISQIRADQLNMNKTREEIMNQGGFDNALYNGVRGNKINKDEFTALQMYQAETERLRQKFLQDGKLSKEERRVLDEREKSLTRLYRRYMDGSFKPKYEIGGQDEQGNNRNSEYDKKIYDQYSQLYEGIVGGQITRKEYLNADNNLEKIQRYRGAVGEFSGMTDSYLKKHASLRNALDYNKIIINEYYYNWEEAGSIFPSIKSVSTKSV